MSSKQASLIFFFVAAIYFVLWAIVPFLLEPNFRFDTIEMFIVGKEGVLATYKHPALNSIILEIVYQGFNRNEIAPFFLNQIFFLLTALAIWRIGREFFTPFESLVGVLMFYGYWSFFYSSLNYNHNVPAIAAWSYVMLFALLAIKYDRYRDWIGLGIAIGLGFHFKVIMFFVVMSILIFTIINSSTRKFWLRGGVYLTIFISFIIASPIIYWVVVSEFSFLKFPLADQIDKTLINWFFILFDILITVPLLLLSYYVLFLPLSKTKFKLTFKEKSELDSNQVLAGNFLFGVSFIAWLLTSISCLVFFVDRDLHDFSHIFIFTGLIFIAFFKTTQSSKAVRLFFIFFTITMACYVIGYCTHIYVAYNFRKEVWYLFPGKELAAEVEKIWYKKYDKPLRYITGKWTLAGNVAIYSKDRPTCHCDYENFPLTTWSTDQDVAHAGGIAIWKTNDTNVSLPDWIIKRFPEAEYAETIKLQPLTLRNKKPYYAGVAIIPPNDSIKPQKITPAPIRLWTIK
ncbi:MAG: glycosyltransferase family 39 protein [Planctomycetaceae bacterium]|jgi:hypothetical protein|nr:glycosyltransferase family 39 protein [Planctomycetaceae bacterium]